MWSVIRVGSDLRAVAHPPDKAHVIRDGFADQGRAEKWIKHQRYKRTQRHDRRVRQLLILLASLAAVLFASWWIPGGW